MKTPLRATSIIPLDRVTPKSTPIEANARAFLKGATFEPTALFKKFTASFATPTVRSIMVKVIVITKRINANSNSSPKHNNFTKLKKLGSLNC